MKRLFSIFLVACVLMPCFVFDSAAEDNGKIVLSDEAKAELRELVEFLENIMALAIIFCVVCIVMAVRTLIY